ncbi:pyridoxine/pyridoxamine 5'-phosphate oxidase [Chloropicon primus]|uniref:Pyridoxine/pyridoxamine 5'-phosphate oxidase n=1 Tax=Chloropicon primus TaxID=1764295 RepID=A0A5B8MFA9_9CHLO|nr:pyridoxine/pyridoxamine 5'-phosphate oxidase [Chloropicon primus]UPQ98327.1 pyridoxine/pyridoxamine 5'-phosphate oxidase [Chloropicon primus]|mmetsp:Transcript_5078/g.15247  ORF Transcript_5078/g.15247 Transcript_5078/m.15247 type:complete len:199 (+) Transcript_5078:1-597(+)|eukprot:QDZ19119.1 pyridoxine/pyridoxamine 5'-phosphate oxidase [Chloropicon primus]
MAAPLWRERIVKSLKKNSRLAYARYAQLATVREDGKPSNRTVVYRGFLEDTAKLTFVTDRRSKKVNELGANPWVELCWYFPQTREQYRIAGKMRVVQVGDGDEGLLGARGNAWRRLSDGARGQFAWPFPGLERGRDDSAFSPDPPVTQDQSPLDEFCLLVLDPDHVDHLNLKSNERCVFSRATGDSGGEAWDQLRVNP